MIKLVRKIYNDFELYCHQMPCLGFNSSSYDIPLMKTHLIPHLHLECAQNKPFVIKRNSKYSCLAIKKLKFLDMLSYLPAGTSYEKFLVTFKIQQRKGMFCCEFFDTLDRFNHPSLPPKEAFYSELKQCSVLGNDTHTPTHTYRTQNHRRGSKTSTTRPDTHILHRHQLRLSAEGVGRTSHDHLQRLP
jgi:hypothetical protein